MNAPDDARPPSVSGLRERNKSVIPLYRASNGTGEENWRTLLLLTTRGAKTGQAHTTPMRTRENGRDLIVVASCGGQRKNPQWYANLVAHPEVTVEYGAETIAAIASTVQNGPERDRLFAMMQEVVADLYQYQDRCRESRQIPLIRLEREA